VKVDKCLCYDKSALYADMGVIKCQYCTGAVDRVRARRFIEANIMKREIKEKNRHEPFTNDYIGGIRRSREKRGAE